MEKIRSLIKFLNDSYMELKRVTWPSYEMIAGGTAAVILVSLVFVIYMWIIDLIVTQLLGLILR